MITVKFTKKQLGDLHTFLSRSELKGSEVPVYVDILNTLLDAQRDYQASSEISNGNAPFKVDKGEDDNGLRSIEG